VSVALSFVAPPPGLAPHTEFQLTPVDGADGLFTMRAAAQPELRVYLVDPRTLVEDYSPVVSDEHVAELALASADDAMLLVVARHAHDGVSVNLLAPVVVNRTTGAAAQVILEDQGYPLRALLS
jgi:flagellar assembly factor FliW